MNTSKTRQEPTAEWKHLDWRKAERAVFKLQKRIYKASQRGEVKAVRRLQKTLMKSWYARCLSVRRVTQDNAGKKTAGVDGVKSLSPEARFRLVTKLKLGSKVRPTRRVWIPKPGTDEKRPLGIPTMYDRALQALILLALEPEWEAKFEPNSYGFRPGRSCHDAIGAIYIGINHMPKYVLDADISKCFDRIDHEALLLKLNTSPTIRRQVRAWLKAGVMDGKQLFPTSEGTPQGGVISPLLANIALHGMEDHIKKAFPRRKIGMKGKSQINSSVPDFIRYADDFVILHEEMTVVQRCREIISEWLKDMGLELKPSKTRLTHTLKECAEEKPGFNFLGFNIKQWKVGQTHYKTREWVAKKYWQTIGDANWVFATRQEGKNPMRLRSHAETPIVRHVKVKGEASPYDGNLIYWSSRMGKHPEVTERVATLLKKQKGKCTHCGLYFREEDVLEIDHIIPKILGGKDQYDNLQILHRHCHDVKTTEDGSAVKYT